jgi:hypothetical protein
MHTSVFAQLIYTNIVTYILLVLGKDSEINKYKTAVTEQRFREQPCFYANEGYSMEERCFLCEQYRYVISRTS